MPLMAKTDKQTGALLVLPHLGGSILKYPIQEMEAPFKPPSRHRLGDLDQAPLLVGATRTRPLDHRCPRGS